MRYFIILLLLLCSSCIQMIGDPEPIRYYLLEGLANQTEAYSNKDLTIDIKLTNFPTFLDRPQIITLEQNSISFSIHDHWAEPLQEHLTQVLRENLRILLPAAKITVSPWEPSIPGSIHSKIMFNNFARKLDDHTDVDIRWTIERGNGETLQGHFVEQQLVGDSYQELVAGLSNGINNFSMELAKRLTAE